MNFLNIKKIMDLIMDPYFFNGANDEGNASNVQRTCEIFNSFKNIQDAPHDVG